MKISEKAEARNIARRRSKLQNNLSAWILALPMLIILYLFVWRSTFFGAWWSLCKMKAYSAGEFIGLQNYIKVISYSQFWPILMNTIWYVIWSLVFCFLPPLIVAVMINEVTHFKNGFKMLIYLPTIIPGIAAMLIWRYIYNPEQLGLLNMILANFGFSPYQWLSDANFVIVGIVIFMAWKGIGMSMLLYYAALQGVSVELYEASVIDGATPFKRFWHVTRPAIEGLLLLNLIRQIIGVFQTMEQPLAMTDGGPHGASKTLAYLLYQYGFNSGGKGTGQAMALGVIIFLILIVFTLFYFWLNKKVENRY